ncbi:MAG: anti-sigma regulatory factor, partial [Candidatus Sericytochromatia bacterium]
MGALKLGLVHQPTVGEVHIGDAYYIHEGDGFTVVAVADGLGHGKEAEFASHKAMAYIAEHVDKTPIGMLEGCHK